MARTESDALRQAFIDHGKRYKLEFSEIPPGSDLSEVTSVCIVCACSDAADAYLNNNAHELHR